MKTMNKIKQATKSNEVTKHVHQNNDNSYVEGKLVFYEKTKGNEYKNFKELTTLKQNYEKLVSNRSTERKFNPK